jgi:hypothetical protein
MIEYQRFAGIALSGVFAHEPVGEFFLRDVIILNRKAWGLLPQ